MQGNALSTPWHCLLEETSNALDARKLYTWHLPVLAQGHRYSLNAPIPQGVVKDDRASGPCHLLQECIYQGIHPLLDLDAGGPSQLCALKAQRNPDGALHRGNGACQSTHNLGCHSGIQHSSRHASGHHHIISQRRASPLQVCLGPALSGWASVGSQRTGQPPHLVVVFPVNIRGHL